MIITYLKLFCKNRHVYHWRRICHDSLDRAGNSQEKMDEQGRIYGNVCLDSIVARSFCGKYIHFRGI